MSKKKMSKDEAKELYRDFQQAMQKMQAGQASTSPGADPDVAKEIAKAIKESMSRDDRQKPAAERKAARGPAKRATSNPLLEPSISRAAAFASRFSSSSILGTSAAFSAFAFLILMKVGMAVLEISGVASVPQAAASLSAHDTLEFRGTENRFERIVLTKLDDRRKELEERERQIEVKNQELAEQERALSTRLIEMRELTDKLRQSRETDDRQKEAQLEQLANIYGSMNPAEAAALLEQLDTPIALELLGRMPGKRIGQILSLMTSERALALTRMLSGR